MLSEGCGRNAPRERPSETVECSTIADEGSGGSPSFSPTSTTPTGATRRARAATASPAETAAVTAAVPPPRKTSTQLTLAASSARVAILRTPHEAANDARRSGLPSRCSNPGAANQPKRSSARSPRRGDDLLARQSRHRSHRDRTHPANCGMPLSAPRSPDPGRRCEGELTAREVPGRQLARQFQV